MNHIGRILRTFFVAFTMLRILDIVFQRNADHFLVALRLAISVQEVRIIQMRLILAYIAIVFINATLIGSRDRAFISTCPLTEHAGSITIVLHDFGQDDMCRIIRMLPHPTELLVHPHINHRHIAPILLVATHLGMSRVLTGHERSTRRSTHRTTSVCLCKSHPLAGHTVQVRSVDVLLAIASQIIIPQIITHDVNDIRFLFFLLATTSTHQRHHGP